ncbi:MAG: hypothetical protein ABFQ65_02150 [Nanoarchaeota archaeon]
MYFKTVNRIGQDYTKLCIDTFCSLGIENGKNLRFIRDLGLMRSAYEGDFVLIQNTGISLGIIYDMKKGIFESSLDSFLRVFPEIRE